MGNSNEIESDPNTTKVILHQFPRARYAPSASPFALKLETWLVDFILMSIRYVYRNLTFYGIVSHWARMGAATCRRSPLLPPS